MSRLSFALAVHSDGLPRRTKASTWQLGGAQWFKAIGSTGVFFGSEGEEFKHSKLIL